MSIHPPIIYNPEFVPDPDGAFKALKEELAWVRRDMTPRNEYYCNDFPKPYTYGKGKGQREYQPMPYHPLILAIRYWLQKELTTSFEVCFLNYYKDQKDQLGWHSDNSPEMDDARPIAIVSLGVEREIWFRPIGSQEQPFRLKLGHGSLCVMEKGMQDYWQHRIPKADHVCGERISLTFRGYVRLDESRNKI